MYETTTSPRIRKGIERAHHARAANKLLLELDRRSRATSALLELDRHERDLHRSRGQRPSARTPDCAKARRCPQAQVVIRGGAARLDASTQ